MARKPSRIHAYLYPLALGLAVAYVLTGLLDRPPPLSLVGPEELMARSSENVINAPSTVILERNILGLGAPTDTLDADEFFQTAPGEVVQRFYANDPANWSVLGVIHGDEPMAMISADGESRPVRPGENVYQWTLERISPTEIIWRSGNNIRIIDLALFAAQANATQPGEDGLQPPAAQGETDDQTGTVRLPAAPAPAQ